MPAQFVVEGFSRQLQYFHRPLCIPLMPAQHFLNQLRFELIYPFRQSRGRVAGRVRIFFRIQAQREAFGKSLQFPHVTWPIVPLKIHMGGHGQSWNRRLVAGAGGEEEMLKKKANVGPPL